MSEVLIYENDQRQIEVRVQSETVWLTQRQMADLFGKNVRTISEHIRTIYASGELDEQTTIRKFRIVQREGKRTVSREVIHYNLDMVISVGYRVNSIQGTRFRIWATRRLLKETGSDLNFLSSRTPEGRSGIFGSWQLTRCPPARA